MKRSFCGWLFWIMLSFSQVFAEDVKNPQWGARINNVQLALRLKNDLYEIKTNQQFHVLVCIKNCSTNEILYSFKPLATRADTDFLLIVKSPSGKDISPPIQKVISDSGAIIHVNPNQTYEYEFNLKSICNFDEVGTYEVIAKKNFGTNADRPCWAISNSLHIKVVPGEWKSDKTNTPPTGF